MDPRISRRRLLLSLGALGAWPLLAGAADAGPGGADTGAAPAVAPTLIGAAWRGPKADDPYYAGVLAADWAAKSIAIRNATALPTRPHGLLAEADGGLLVLGVRPGAWIWRLDAAGAVVRRLALEDEPGPARLNGHVVLDAARGVLFTTETDPVSGRGRIGVRDRQTLRKLDEWDSHGIEPHQLLLDAEGHLVVANGGVPRTASDRKYDLHRMDSSLVRLDGRNGALRDAWQLDDRRLSLRHLAWNVAPATGEPLLGIAMQAEHDDPLQRAKAPIFALLAGGRLTTPARGEAGAGYSGDITAAGPGGFVLSSNQAGLAQLWLPERPERLQTVVALEEAYALAPWSGPAPGGGVLVATGLGLVRWHPAERPAFLAWPRPMALDNHWVALSA